MCYLINKSPHASLNGKVIEAIWTCNPIDLENLWIFGCPAYVHIFSEDGFKLDLKLKKYVFDDYVKGVTGFKLRDPINVIIFNRDVVFNK